MTFELSARKCNEVNMKDIQSERRSSSSERYDPSDKEGLLSIRDPELRTHRTWLRQPLTMPILHIALILGYTLLFFILQHNAYHSNLPLNEHLVYCKKAYQTIRSMLIIPR